MASINLWKNIKSAFVVEDETLVENEQKSSKASAKSAQKDAVPFKEPPMVSESTDGQPGKVTSKFINVLLGAMEEANLDGFDYLEYKQSLTSLAKMPMDEKTRFQSAYAMAQKLVDTATHYINVLKQEEHKFEKALSNQIDGNIGNKSAQIGQLESVIDEKAKQIQRLTEEIAQHQTEIDGLKKEISKATVKVETTKNNFRASYNRLVGQIHDDVEKMKVFLK